MVIETSTARGATPRHAKKTPRRDGRARAALSAAVQAGKSVGSAVRAAAETGPSWYRAAFASPGAQHNGRERSVARRALGDGIAQNATTLPRVQSCGTPIGHSSVALKRGTHDGGGIYAAGVETCGSPWSCPPCAAKIRNHRAGDIVRAVEEADRRGYGVILPTWTLPHGMNDSLASSLNVLKEAMRAMRSGKAYVEDCARYGILGRISSYEITHGENGWHPHAHELVFTETVLSRDAASDLESRWQARWNLILIRKGWSPSVVGIGVKVERVRKTAEAAARYVAKLQEGERWDVNAANEVARGDLKGGRKSSRVPFEIAADFLTDGTADDLDLWQEYEQATRGKSSIRWSRGLRALLLPDEPAELTDEEAAAETIDGEAVVVLDHWLYRQVRARPYGVSHLFGAAEAGGVTGVRRFVRSLGLDVRGVHEPDPSINVSRKAA